MIWPLDFVVRTHTYPKQCRRPGTFEHLGGSASCTSCVNARASSIWGGFWWHLPFWSRTVPGFLIGIAIGVVCTLVLT